ncbi:hypothetical protein ACIHAX_22895 [Nocardia sp. NPDC051929]|uniref:hypothetical protein n=1 Tax=unclassified Nocardia TaxID=2637762 RepID=UPI0034333ACC
MRAGRRGRRRDVGGGRGTVAELVAADPVLRNFPVDDLRALFEDNCNRLANDPVLGCAHVLRQIAKAMHKPAEADAVVRTGILIGGEAGACGPAAKRARAARRRPRPSATPAGRCTRLRSASASDPTVRTLRFAYAFD